MRVGVKGEGGEYASPSSEEVSDIRITESMSLVKSTSYAASFSVFAHHRKCGISTHTTVGEILSRNRSCSKGSGFLRTILARSSRKSRLRIIYLFCSPERKSRRREPQQEPSAPPSRGGDGFELPGGRTRQRARASA